MSVSDKEMAPRVRPHPGTRPTDKETTVDTTKSSAPAHPSPAEKHLAKLEERYRHECMDDEERGELEDLVLRLRRRITREEG